MKYLIPLVLLFSLSAHADIINHIDAQASILGVQSFDGSFNWDVTTQTVVPGSSSIAMQGPLEEAFPLFDTIGDNFAEWTNASSTQGLQIDIRPYVSAGDTLTFNDLGTYNQGVGHIEYWGFIPGVAGGAFGNWYGLTGTLTVTDPPDTQVPEPATWLMLIAGLAVVSVLAFRKGVTL